MKVAIIGTGRMGTALAAVLAEAGHQVSFGSRDPEKAKAAAAAVAGATGGSHQEAVDGAELVFLAAPHQPGNYPSLEMRPLLNGKVVVDMANPLDWAKGLARTIPADTSTAEELAAAVPGARVVSTLKTVGQALLQNRVAADLLLCSDDAEAKELVGKCFEGTPFRPLDAGPLSAARAQEMLVPVLFTIGKKHKLWAMKMG